MKVVKVPDETHKELVKIKEKSGFSFGYIISLGIHALEGKELSIMQDAPIVEMVVNIRKARPNYDTVKKLFNKGCDIFIPDISSRQAARIRRKMENIMGKEITNLENENGGFLFMLLE